MTSLNLVQKYFTSIKNLENQRRRKNHPGKAKQAKALMVLVLGNSVISEPTETSKFLYHSLLQNYPRTTITDQANEVGKRTDEVLHENMNKLILLVTSNSIFTLDFHFVSIVANINFDFFLAPFI